MTPTTERRPARAALAMVGAGLLVAGVLSGEQAAFAAHSPGGDTTISALSSSFSSGGGSILVGADITATASTLTLSPTAANSGWNVLDLNGYALTVRAIQQTTSPGGSVTGSNLRIIDSGGGGSLTVTQTSGTLPAMEVDGSSSLEVWSGTVNASVPAGSSAAAIGGGPTAGFPQTSGSIRLRGSSDTTATAAGSGAAIGAGSGAVASAIIIEGGAHVTAINNGTGAAIGDGSGTAGASILIGNNTVVQATQNSTGNSGAAIGGGASPSGQVAGAVTIGDTADVSATSLGKGAAIGGGYRGDGGSLTVTGYAQVHATGAQAAIGDGEQATGAGTSVSLSGSGVVVTAHGGTGSSGGAGVGGGLNAYGNDSLSVGNGATLTASSANGPGIGGLGNTVGMTVSVSNATVTATGGPTSAGIGAGSSGSFGAAVSIANGGTVTASGGSRAIGGSTVGRFGSLSNSGTLVVPAGTTLAVPPSANAASDGTVVLGGVLDVAGTFTNTGLITNTGTISGAGTLANSGTIRQYGTVTAPVSGNNFTLAYDPQAGSTGTTTQRVYADTTAAAQVTIPTAAPPSAGVFTGWNAKADGTGTDLTASGSIGALVGATSTDGSPVVVRVYALYQLNPVLPTGTTLAQAVVGSPYSSTVAATSGTAPITYSYTGSFPAGLTFNTGSGVIGGTPTTAGTFTMHVVAANAAGTSTHDYTIQVVPTVLTVSVPATPKTNARYLAGATVAVTLGGLQANEAYSVSIGGTKVYSGTAPTNAAFVIKVKVPKTVKDGSQNVVLSGGGHVATGAAGILTASVTKHLALKASTKKVKAKKKFSLTISKLYASESVRVVIKGAKTTTATGKASSKGVFTLTVKKGLKKGKYTVTVTGAGTSRTAKVKLTVK